MGWIKERILAEHRKYDRITGGLDWARLAEQKILAQIKEQIKESGAMLKEYFLQAGRIEFSMTRELIPVEILEDVISGASNHRNQHVKSGGKE